MLQTLNWVKVLTGAAIDDNSKIYALGNNQALTFTAGTTGGGSFRLSGSPAPDRMKVQSFAATVSDTNSRPYRGVRLALGLLTNSPHEPVVTLHAGVTGDNGSPWVRVPFQFRTEFGLWVHFPYYAPSRTYYLRAVVNYEPA